MNITPDKLKEVFKESISEIIISKEPKMTLTIAECAKASGIGRDKITELIYRNEIPHFKVGTKTLINRQLFMSWLDNAALQRKVF